jgi:pyrrolidone-carboxylate peptidase
VTDVFSFSRKIFTLSRHIEETNTGEFALNLGKAKGRAKITLP